MKTPKIEVAINDRFKLVCEVGIRPYEKELNVYVEDKIACDYQDIARISPEYDLDKDGNVTYEDDRVSLKIFTDENNEDFTEEHLIPVRCPERELSISEIIALEKLEVEQNIHYVEQYEKVNLVNFVTDNKLDLKECKNSSNNLVTDYDSAYFDYTLTHKGSVVLECVPREDVEKYINEIISHYKLQK